jgi:hypothetical protein
MSLNRAESDIAVTILITVMEETRVTKQKDFRALWIVHTVEWELCRSTKNYADIVCTPALLRHKVMKIKKTGSWNEKSCMMWKKQSASLSNFEGNRF